MDSRINPEKDFVFKEGTLLEDALNTLYKLPIYASYYAETRAAADKAEQELKNIEAKISMLVRIENKDKKYTENTIASLIRTNDQTQSAVNSLTDARRELYYAEGYWKAIQKTCDMIQMIGYSKNAEMKRL